jgi:hypothetical protein
MPESPTDSRDLGVKHTFDPKNVDKAIPGLSREKFEGSLMGAVCKEKPELGQFLDEKNRLIVSNRFLLINPETGDISWVSKFGLAEVGDVAFQMPAFTIPEGAVDETPDQIKVREAFKDSKPYRDMYEGKRA